MTTDPPSGAELITNVKLDNDERRFLIRWLLGIVGAVAVPLIGVGLGMWRGQAITQMQVETLGREMQNQNQVLSDKISTLGRQTDRIENRLDAAENRRLGKGP